MFERKSNGDPLSAIADLVTKLTYSEMLSFAEGIKADPAQLHSWAKHYGLPQVILGGLSKEAAEAVKDARPGEVVRVNPPVTNPAA